MLKPLIDDLVKELELEYPLDEEGGVYELPVEEGKSIDISDLHPGYRFSGVVCPLTKIYVEDFLVDALSGNLFGMETEGCALGVDTKEKNLILTKNVIKNTDYQEFSHCLEQYLNAMDIWVERVRLHEEEAKDALL